MALVTCAGVDVLRAELHLPLRGAWFADLVLDTATMPSGRATIAAADGATLQGTIIGGGVFLDAARVRVVGGAGGLATVIPAAAYQQAQLRDPLGAIANAAGESLSSLIDGGILGTSLAGWTVNAYHAARALDELAAVVGAGWRMLSDGMLWMGAEAWPTVSLPTGSDILEQHPEERRFVVGATTPSLLPGTAVDGIGRVVAVDHFVEHDRVRSWAWI